VTEEGKGKGAITAAGRSFRRIDAELDRGASGPLWLQDPRIAGCVEDAILRGEKLGHYSLSAYVVMPNHVHVLLHPSLPLARITNGIKGVSARDANAILGRVGKPFWEDESFDHWVRIEAEFERIRAYIERNPVSAGLVERPEDWPWSSARRNKIAQARVPVPQRNGGDDTAPASTSGTATPGCARR
jgi:REP element-mobilizing transposase RayT